MPEFIDKSEEASFYDQSGDDRSIMKRLVKMVEDRLAQALQVAILPSEIGTHLLFDSDGPLGNFDAKIRAARALSLIAEDVFEDLGIVNKIVKAFEDVGMTFESQLIADYIESLKALDVHRQLYLTDTVLAENASRVDRLEASILDFELDDRKSQFRLCMRFYINLLAKFVPSASRGIYEDRNGEGSADNDGHEFVAGYSEKVKAFEALVSTATSISYNSGGRQASGKQWWAASLFTRLCTMSVSILMLVPRSSFASRKLDHWDFGSLAPLVRNLMECYLTFFYLCIEEVDEIEWKARITIMHLRDNLSRLQLFQAFNTHTDTAGYDAHAADLRNRLLNNAFFMLLPEKQRKRFLKGDVALLLSQDEIVTRMGGDVSTFRGIYKFFSAQVHSTPMAFYRTGRHNRGRGLENVVEKKYIAMALDYAGEYVLRATREMVGLFPDLKALIGEDTKGAATANDELEPATRE
jgi:hypothetical protein